MEWTGLNDLREKYLSFFESKNHTRMASASLIPHGDNSLLLINSGMAPLKKFFLGTETPPNVRVTTCQKCIRTPDIERVGKTARHGTYFEMLGNFSFGDYFKHEAIAWAWEFLTKELEIPADRLWITIYESDDEAEEIWEKEIGIPHDRIVRLGKADNFWEHGSGPCGPCSEIHFDRGEAYGPFESFEQAGDCDRIIEIWNLVFSQFDSDGKGNYAEMASKNIDTGMGLERLACVMQNVDNLFEVDTVQNIMKHISEIAGVKYKENEKTDVSLRVITDHIRSTTFMVGDGVTVSNTGRGYVLRRLLRRAARHGRLLGIKEPFLYKVCDTVIDENKCAYPELEEKREYIKKAILREEENFAKTIDSGMEVLEKMLSGIEKGGVLSGEDTFKLSDTYGFPFDLTKEIAEERGISVDEEGFNECVKAARELAKADHAAKGGSSWDDDTLSGLTVPATEFTGYTDFEAQSKVLAIFKDNQQVSSISEGDDAVIILDKTPFYAESGGQVGDEGVLTIGESSFTVTDTKKTANGQYLHFGTADVGGISEGDTVTAAIDKERRLSIMRNHTCAHLLQAALRTVLGDHVHQAGQLVNGDRVRFDFSHFEALTADELKRVEALVNQYIFDAIDVTMTEMPIEEARKLGAMALFGEKYGNIVRVVEAKGASIEFCGGTHISNTAKIGLFKILSESSVAAGVRRIEAVTGTGVLALIEEYKDNIEKSAQAFKLVNHSELPAKCAAAAAEIKTLEKEKAELNSKLASSALDGIMDKAVDVNGTKLVTVSVKNTAPDVLRSMGDKIKDMSADVIAVLAADNGATGSLLCVCGKNAVTKGAHAGKIVQKLTALTGGKGGGRPDSAMGGIGDNSKISDALDAAAAIAAEFVK
ncbi:MAG: alanine--tRNA ligase [Oscillospiraceae bacterium]|nr:alanine--tRNA ligase [Oscillospiraceae bacterium]